MKRIMVSLVAVALMLLMCTGLAYPAHAEGTAPVAENLELNTFRNVSVGGRLSAYDPDGDITGYEISTDPVKGLLEVSRDGKFTYTPGEDKKGKDYFGYKAVDSKGNYSQEATVIIKIEKQRSKVSYSDMDGVDGEYYAVALSEKGIFTGEQICGEYCFYPEKNVSRGEFISMCMLVAKKPLINGVVSTGYMDDDEIPSWMKSYAVTAAMCRVDDGSLIGNDKVFSPEEPINRGEAMAILNKALELNDVSYVELDSAMDMAMAQVCANLSASGIIGEASYADEKLDRIGAAELLIKAVELIEKR